jgi:hypothetical protein
MTTLTDLDQYLDAVAQELADLAPDERAALLEDLREHLAEVSAETNGSLGGLGSPQEYAAELRAAAGLGESSSIGGPSARWRRRVHHVARAVERGRENKLVRDAVGFLPQLRPAWWLLRAYIVVVAFAMWTDRQSQAEFPFVQIAGERVVGLVVLAVAVYGSIALGLRTRNLTRPRVMLIAANVVIVLLGLSVANEVRNPRYVYVDTSAGVLDEGTLRTPAGSVVTNIYAYDSSGRLLQGVLLYDQAGRPIGTNSQFAASALGAEAVETQCRIDRNGAPVPNAYPLHQRRQDYDDATGSLGWQVVRPPAVQAPQLQPPVTTTARSRPRAATKSPPLAPCTP